MRVPPAQSATAPLRRASAAAESRPPSSCGDARQARAEHERLDARPRGDERLHVEQQPVCVGPHRAGGVADDDEPARPQARLVPAAAQRLAAVAHRLADRAPHVDGGVAPAVAAAARAQAAAAPQRAAACELDHQRGDALELGRVERREVSAPQRFEVAPAGRRRRRRLVVIVAGVGRARPARLAAPLDRRRRSRRGRGQLTEGLFEGGFEGVVVGVRRAERAAQRVIGLVAVGGVDGGERAVRGQQLAEADAHARRRASPPASAQSCRLTRSLRGHAANPPACAASTSSWTFSTANSVVVEVVGAEREQRLGPGDRLTDPGPLVELLFAQQGDGAADLADDLGRGCGDAHGDDLQLALDRRVVDPRVQAAPLERVVQLARAVGGDEHDRAAGARRSCRSRGS